MHPFTLAAVNAANLNSIVFFIVGGAVLVAWSYLEYRAARLWHETARLALEKGQPLPPWIGDEDYGEEAPAATTTVAAAPPSRRRPGLLGGLLLVAVGAGLYLGLERSAPTLSHFAAVPAFTGAALLLHSLIDALLPRKNPEAGDRAPLS
jgi:hypothetical protein